MADMYGSLHSSLFKVKDIAAFKDWFTRECSFSCEFEVVEVDGAVFIRGGGANPRAIPDRITVGDSHDDWDIDEFGLQEFAEGLRAHLCDGEEVRIMAAGDYKGWPIATAFCLLSNGNAFELSLGIEADSVAWLPQMREALLAAGVAEEPDWLKLANQHGGPWANHPDHPLQDWQYQVTNGDTRMGYWEWVLSEENLAAD